MLPSWLTGMFGGPKKDAGVALRGRPLEMAADETTIMRVMDKAASVRLPLIGDWPLQKQLTLLVAVFSGAIVIFLLSAGWYVYRSANLSKLTEITGATLMHSQRLAKAVPTAVQGNVEAFKQLRDSLQRINDNVKVLSAGGDYEGRSVRPSSAAIQPFLDKLAKQWKVTDESAKVVLQQEKILTSFGTTLTQLNDANPLLLELTDQITALKLQGGASAAEISASGRLMMLTQRLVKNANELLASETVRPETPFLLGKDASTFNDLINGLTNGSDTLNLRPARDPELKERLSALEQAFSNMQGSVRLILGNLSQFAEAKLAQQVVFRDSEALRQQLSDLQEAYTTEQNGLGLYTIFMAVSAVIALTFLIMLAMVYLADQKARSNESDRQRREAERLEAEAKRQNDSNQAAILRLMNELQEVADGDLTIHATVSEDITGAIADSVNYTVEELRGLVARINSTAEEVTNATTQAQETSSRLLQSTDAQSREIRETGQAVLKMAQQINEVSNSAAESANVARQSLQAAEQGAQAVQNAIAGMNEIRDQIQETSKRIKRLGESSQEIGEIIELISDITEQTNVLALNAAIQAASAGEAGRGFSVVAEEVQRLAERSGEATKQIAALVRTIQTDTQDAVSAMEKSTQGVVDGARLSDAAGQSLGDIGRVSRQLSELIEGISQSTSQQAVSASGVAQNIERILMVTEQTTEGTQLTANAIRQLAELALELKNSVARFRVS
ncbi:MAG: methyl-accepting chemotaxis protein [Burkholderiaceae bacterium]|nr:MAG: methyl-accepting chemotaxis protein [Burkholderiaceae bacterium]